MADPFPKPSTDTVRFVGKYRIEGTLGKGAMGVVFAGHDPGIDRPVAIKTIHTHLVEDEAGAEFTERFGREARAAGRVTHPNLVTIFDFFVENSVPYLVMERVQSNTLKDFIAAQTPINLKQVHNIFVQILEGLDAIHAAGIVHRDLKPANVMFAETGQIKLTDFGVARLIDMEASQAGLVGTPSYMAREQILGHAVDARADIYSCGVMLYEVLTRQKPFATGGVEAVYHAMEHQRVTPPSTLVPGLPATFDSVVMKALRLNPAERFGSVQEMSLALSQALATADSTVTQVPIGPPAAAEPDTSSDTMIKTLNHQTMHQLEQDITACMGPIGPVIARRVAVTARNAQEMVDEVLKSVPNSAEREALRNQMEETLFGLEQTGAPPLHEQDLSRLSALLASHIGPIAPVLLKREAAACATFQDLVTKLATFISGSDERERFVQAASETQP